MEAAEHKKEHERQLNRRRTGTIHDYGKQWKWTRLKVLKAEPFCRAEGIR